MKLVKKSPNQMWNESRSTKNDLFSSRKTIGHKYIEEQKRSENRTETTVKQDYNRGIFTELHL